ncbi:sulfite exporter TauE/SafE family protein (plasmid) [Skermanella rosea]|uniref:sulfite exporter TauE/SafE family protein n=1 Tax=Skermanella rosea TaxID=1817965 RepID=UPI001E449B54|nr:sulfite exporter TauE/SafE family protein [Skermanella rosea]UEM07417.1 sulfite exporter TauE/SafE family protein [Skermanella rosea]
MSAGTILVIAAVVLATSFLSGIFGMAGGMIYMGALLLLLPVPAAMVLHGVTQTASNGWRAFLWRGYVAWPILLRYLIGSALAFAAFSLVRFVPDPALVLVTLGLTPFLAWTVPDRLAPRADRAGGAELCGFIGTAFQLLSGVSGPLLDVFFVRCPLDRRAVVATKAACQVATHLIKLVYFGQIIGGAGDSLGWPVLALSVALAMAGTSLSRAALERLTDVQFRSWTQRIVLGVGLVYLVQGIAAYAGG